MHYLQNYLYKLNLTMIHMYYCDNCFFIISLSPNANSWYHPDVSTPYQHLCMHMQKNINFHIVAHTRLTPQLKHAIRQCD